MNDYTYALVRCTSQESSIYVEAMCEELIVTIRSPKRPKRCIVISPTSARVLAAFLVESARASEAETFKRSVPAVRPKESL